MRTDPISRTRTWTSIHEIRRLDSLVSRLGRIGSDECLGPDHYLLGQAMFCILRFFHDCTMDLYIALTQHFSQQTARRSCTRHVRHSLSIDVTNSLSTRRPQPHRGFRADSDFLLSRISICMCSEVSDRILNSAHCRESKGLIPRFRYLTRWHLIG